MSISRLHMSIYTKQDKMHWNEGRINGSTFEKERENYIMFSRKKNCQQFINLTHIHTNKPFIDIFQRLRFSLRISCLDSLKILKQSSIIQL